VIEADADSLRLEECGAIRTPSAESAPRRLDAIYGSVLHLCRSHEPSALAVEELFFNRNVQSAMSVAQARGVILLAGEHYREEQGGTPRIEEYNPSTVKKAITGHGGADKPAVQKIVREELSLSAVPEPSDAADALALALCHFYTDRFPAVDDEPTSR